jgi:hypothetical protein
MQHVYLPLLLRWRVASLTFVELLSFQLHAVLRKLTGCQLEVDIVCVCFALTVTNKDCVKKIRIMRIGLGNLICSVHQVHSSLADLGRKNNLHPQSTSENTSRIISCSRADVADQIDFARKAAPVPLNHELTLYSLLTPCTVWTILRKPQHLFYLTSRLLVIFEAVAVILIGRL